MSTPTVLSLAQIGFGKGTNELYDRARPSYPASALSYIRGAVKSSPPLNIIEIGAGTGIFTRALLAHPEWSSSVNKLRAIEPSEGMREVFTRSALGDDDRVSIAEGTFDTTNVEDGWADLIVIAQAFHWCPDHEAAAKEFARILKPNGVTVLIWNLEDRKKAGWVAQLRDRVEPHERGSPQFRLGLWRKMFDGRSYLALFQPPEMENWTYALPGTVQIAVDRACSKSYIAVLPEGEKAKVVRDVRAIVERGDDKVWMNEEEGVFEYPYETAVVVMRKK